MNSGLQVYESEVRDAEAEVKNYGPVCGQCGKPSFRTGPKGRCDCPRYADPPEQRASRVGIEERQAIALEGILTALTAIAVSMGVKLPEVKTPVSAPDIPVTGTPVDQIRAKAKVG